MPELVCRIGQQPKKYHYSGFRFERKGFLSIFSFTASDKKNRQEIMERGHAVVILPVDFERREIYMVEQPRHMKAFTRTKAGTELVKKGRNSPRSSFEAAAARILTLELPAGIIDGGETPAAAAARELKEETGLTVAPSALERIADFYLSLGCCTESVAGFVARINDRTGWTEACGDGEESVAVWKYGWNEAFELMRKGKIESASTLIMLGWLQNQA